jgi:hypothetical protein
MTLWKRLGPEVVIQALWSGPGTCRWERLPRQAGLMHGFIDSTGIFLDEYTLTEVISGKSKRFVGHGQYQGPVQ